MWSGDSCHRYLWGEDGVESHGQAKGKVGETYLMIMLERQDRIFWDRRRGGKERRRLGMSVDQEPVTVECVGMVREKCFGELSDVDVGGPCKVVCSLQRRVDVRIILEKPDYCVKRGWCCTLNTFEVLT
jgi:hypothetical protein